jgi:hypothetical protein
MRKVIGMGMAGLVGLSLLAAPAIASASPRDPGHPDVHVSGQWGSATYRLDLSSYGKAKIESDLNVRHAPSGQKWTITMKDNGVTFFQGVRTVRSGELEAKGFAPNGAGADRIKVIAKRGGTTYSASGTF